MSYVSQQMPPASGEIAMSRDRYNMMRFSVGGLGLAFIGVVLFLLFSQPKVAPPPPPNDALIEEPLDIALPPDVVNKLTNVYDIQTVVFIDRNSRIRVTGPDGKSLDVCADLQGTEIVERPGRSCGLNGINLLAVNQIHVLYHNPGGGCTSAGGRLVCKR